jgi:hypothetical protein
MSTPIDMVTTSQDAIDAALMLENEQSAVEDFFEGNTDPGR